MLLPQGDVGTHRLEWYSRRIRQRLYALSKEQRWADKYAIRLGTTEDVEGGYSEGLSSSKFCLVVPGGRAVVQAVPPGGGGTLPFD